MENIYIEDKTRLIKNVTRGCLMCKLVFRRKEEKLPDQKIRPSFRPYTHVFSDLVELKLDSGVTVIIITFFCDFTKRLTAEIIPNKEAATVSMKMMEFITHYGGMGRMCITTDNGQEFVGNKTKNLFESLSVEHTTISPKNSQSNRCERTHRDLRNILKSSSVNARNIKHKLSLACSIFNHRPTSSLGFRTPNQVYANLYPPIYFNLKNTFVKEEINVPSYDDHVSDLREWQNWIAKEHLEIYKNHQEVPQEIFKVGDIVILVEDNLLGHQQKGDGPFVIKAIRPNNGVEILSLIDGRRLPRHMRFLRKVHLSEEEKKKMAENDNLVFNSKTCEYGEIPEKQAFNLLDHNYDSDKSTVIQNQQKVSAVPESKYNLRPRTERK